MLQLKILIFLCCFSLASLAQAQILRVTNQKTGEEKLVKPRKIKGLVTKNGEFFEGKFRLFPNYITVREERIAYQEIGFLEVKKFRAVSLVAEPLKLVGGSMMVLGTIVIAATLADAEDSGETDWGVLAAGGVIGGAGLLLRGIGKKTTPRKSNKITALYHKDWSFQYER